MRIYIACPLAHVTEAKRIAYRLSLEGHDVISRWHNIVQPGDVDPKDDDTRIDLLKQNVSDLMFAELVVVFAANGGGSATWGEVGFACAIGKPVVWWHGPNGEGRNLWDCHPSVRRTTDLGGIFVAIQELKRMRGLS